MELFHAITGPPVIVALIGFLMAWWFYIKKPAVPEKLEKSLHGPYELLLNKYWIDELYAAVFVRPLLWISTNVLWHVVDEGIIDGVVNGSARVGSQIRRRVARTPIGKHEKLRDMGGCRSRRLHRALAHTSRDGGALECLFCSQA